MALNGNLNGVLENITFYPSIAPVIKRSDGLYTIVDKNSIMPCANLGTNLKAGYITITDNYVDINILGTWTSSGDYYYKYHNGKWYTSGGTE